MVPVKKKLLQMYKTMVAIRGFEESLAEIVDLRTLSPLDHETLSASVQKTHKAVVIQEACEMAGVAAQVVKSLMQNCFDHLDAPVKTIAALDTVNHNGYPTPLE